MVDQHIPLKLFIPPFVERPGFIDLQVIRLNFIFHAVSIYFMLQHAVFVKSCKNIPFAKFAKYFVISIIVRLVYRNNYV